MDLAKWEEDGTVVTTTTGAPPVGLGRILLPPPGIPCVIIFMPEKQESWLMENRYSKARNVHIKSI